MKGIMGCDAPDLEPGMVVSVPAAHQTMTVIRKVTLEEALEAARAMSPLAVGEVRPEETFYEVDVTVAVPMGSNN